MPALSHNDAEVFQRMAAELRRAAAELRQVSEKPSGGSPRAAETLEAYAAAIIKDLERAYG